jgi:glycosyltransferase involved in cell wall biosynthesis
MIAKKRLIYVDQLVGPTSLDIINSLSEYYEVHLYTGGVIKTYAELHSEVIIHQRISYSKKNSLNRLFTWVWYYFTTVPSLLFAKKNEVFLVSNPPFNFFVGYLISKFFSIRFSLLLFDIYPDILIQSNHISADSWVAKIWIYLNRLSFKKAHRIFTISENLSKEVGKYLADTKNLKVVHNWVNSNEIRPMPREKNKFIHQHNLQDKFIVMYSGNMGETHDLESIVEVANELSDTSDIQFLIIGDGAKKSKIIAMVERFKLSNVTILPFQDPSMFKYSIACADIGFVTLSNGFEAYSVPSKTYYLMAAGCVVFALANKNSELNNLLEQYQFGYRFDPGSTTEIAQQILNIYGDKSLKMKLSENARKAAAYYTHDNANVIAHEVRQ